MHFLIIPAGVLIVIAISKLFNERPEPPEFITTTQYFEEGCLDVIFRHFIPIAIMFLIAAFLIAAATTS